MSAAGQAAERKVGPRICLGLPSLDGKLSFNTQTTVDKITAYLARKGYEVLHKRTMGSGLCGKRHQIVEWALEMGCTHLLFIDADTSCKNMDVIDRLFAHDVDIVAAGYTSKQPPFQYLGSYWDEKEKLWVRLTKEPDAPMIEVDGVGFGLILIKMSVFEAIPKPEEYFLPRWFGEVSRGGNDRVDTQEDYYFCWRAKLAGFKIWLDTLHGDEVYHIGEYGYSISDGRAFAEMDRQRRMAAAKAGKVGQT